MHFSHFRPSLFAVLAACTLGACSTLKPDAPADKSPPPRHEATEDAAASSSKPTQAAPRPRPQRNDKPVRPDKQDKTDRTAPKGEAAVEEAPAPSAAETPLNGPLWLTLCKQRQTEAGIIRCDADELLVRPSAQVKIFTRDPAATGRGIQLRKGLPSKYRFFVVP